MFTRYSDIDIPKNYSGSRFKMSQIEDTTMKVHSSDMQGAVKSSVSPTYNEHLNQFIPQDSYNYSQKSEEIANNVNEVMNEDNYPENELTTFPQEDKIAENNRSLLPTFDFLKNINSDDLLIILLIIVLASDKSALNNDIIIILALLLTSK